jgi:hypothetical protein
VNVGLRLGAFALALAAALGIGAAIGEAAGPLDVRDDEPEHVVDHGSTVDDTTTTTAAGHGGIHGGWGH